MEFFPEQRLGIPENQPSETPTIPIVDGGDEKILDLQKQVKRFTRFSELPMEIRIKIWKLACRKGHIIRVRLRSKVPKMAIPLIAHINRESRSEALRIYALGFRQTRSTCGKMWWNPSVDTIYFTDSWKGLKSCEDALGPSVSRIRQMAMDFYSESLDEVAPYWDVKSLRNFKALETLYLVLDPTYISWMPGMLVFNKAIDGPVGDLNTTPARLEKFITQRLEKSMEELGKRWKLPTIKIVLAEIKGLSKSAWCLPVTPGSREP